MIYDNIKNIERYKNLGNEIYEGLLFIKTAVDEGISTGRHQLNGENYANVEEYLTKNINPNGYESHVKYIDIQFLLSGKENILCKPTEKVEAKGPYDSDRDVTFYHHKDEESSRLTIGDGYFAIFFPDDAHEPQLSINNTPSKVKKIVVKCRV